jgi:hypothetical protein
MNLIPKEIKESLIVFKKYLHKISHTSLKALDLNYSKVFTTNQICLCENKEKPCLECPNIPNFDIYLQSSQFQSTINFLIFIKYIDLQFNIESGIFNLSLLVENQKIIILKGMIKNSYFTLQDYAMPVIINIPNKLIFRINLLNKNDEEYLETTNILDKGVINFGISLN